MNNAVVNLLKEIRQVMIDSGTRDHPWIPGLKAHELLPKLDHMLSDDGAMASEPFCLVVGSQPIIRTDAQVVGPFWESGLGSDCTVKNRFNDVILSHMKQHDAWLVARMMNQAVGEALRRAGHANPSEVYLLYEGDHVDHAFLSKVEAEKAQGELQETYPEANYYIRTLELK